MTHRGVEQLVARQAHNLEVACSSPASATHESGKFHYGICRFSHIKTLHAMRPGSKWADSIFRDWRDRILGTDIKTSYFAKENNLFCQGKQVKLKSETTYFGKLADPRGIFPSYTFIYIIMYTRARGRACPTGNAHIIPPLQPMTTHAALCLKNLKSHLRNPVARNYSYFCPYKT